MDLGKMVGFQTSFAANILEKCNSYRYNMHIGVGGMWVQIRDFFFQGCNLSNKEAIDKCFRVNITIH